MRNSRWHAWVLVLPALLLHFSLHAQTLHPNADVAHAASPNELFTFSHPAMGTTYTLYLYAASGQIAEEEADRAFTIIDDLDSLLSNYKPQSELSRINQQAFTAAVTTDPETFAFLARSLYWSEQSDGAFDISVGALMKAWGFFRSSGHLPSAEELAEVQTRTGWKRVLLDPATRGVRFTNAGVELDPGGIGKGFAVDRVVEMLRKDGVHAALLSAGSSTIYALGSQPGRAGWNIDIPSMPERFSRTWCSKTLLSRAPVAA
jgi:thiamine biosynthesis lipoprotein